jgi:hypothetical protein
MNIVFIQIGLLAALLVFGICWYKHVDSVARGKSKYINSLLGVLLFYAPFFSIIIPLFLLTGAGGGFVTLGVIISMVMSTVLYTSAVVTKHGYQVVIIFMVMNFLLSGALSMIG